MSPPVRYNDIPTEERKHLASEALRSARSLRTVQFTASFLPLLLSGSLADLVLPKGGPFLPHLGVRVIFAVILYAISWAIIVRPRLRAEVEKLKNG